MNKLVLVHLQTSIIWNHVSAEVSRQSFTPTFFQIVFVSFNPTETSDSWQHFFAYSQKIYLEMLKYVTSFSFSLCVYPCVCCCVVLLFFRLHRKTKLVTTQWPAWKYGGFCICCPYWFSMTSLHSRSKARAYYKKDCFSLLAWKHYSFSSRLTLTHFRK